jgi:DNA-binding CsgD family transcriptional regulator
MGMAYFAPFHHTGGLYLLAGAAGSLLVALFASRFQEAGSLARMFLFRITSALILVAVGLLLAAVLADWVVCFFFAIFFGGAATGFLQVLWGERFASHPSQFSTRVAPAAAITTAVVVALTSETTSLVALVLFPLISLALLLTRTDARFGAELFAPAKAAAEKDAGAAEQQQPNATQVDVLKLMVSIAIFSFLCRSYDSFIVLETDPFAFIGGASLLSLIVVGTIFLVFALCAKNRFNATLTYRLSLPIMVIGLVALALFLDRFAAISLLIINVGYEFFDILIWILFAETARRQGEPFRIFGLGVAFTLAGMAAAYMLAPFINDLFTQNGLPSGSFALLSITSLVIVAFLVIPESTFRQVSSFQVNLSDAPPEEQTADAGGSFESRLERQCGVLAAKFGLTAREREVLVLLARGRTLAIIARDLQIANGTARTHIENVYAKLDVHKQQELIDRVESCPL